MDKQKKILIAEDDKFIANIWKVKFAKLGFNVVMAFNGEEALDKLSTDTPDVVLLDLLMPKKDGFQVLTEMKANSLWKDIPVIVASNLAQSEDIKKALALGATDYFVKSNVHLSDIVATVQKAIT